MIEAAKFRAGIAASPAEGLIDEVDTGYDLGYIGKTSVMGDVDQPERLNAGLTKDRALSTEFEQHIDRWQYTLNLGEDGSSLFFAAGRQMLALGSAVCRRGLQSERRHHFALDPAPDLRRAVRIWSELKLMPIMVNLLDWPWWHR